MTASAREVVDAGVEVLKALSRDLEPRFQFDHFDWGGEYYKKHGRMMPEDGREQIRKHDAILFGSAGHPDISRITSRWDCGHLPAVRLNTPTSGPGPAGHHFALCARSAVPNSTG